MKIEILPSAREDLAEGFAFYESQQPGLGTYFLNSLFADIDSLTIYAGIHHRAFGKYRLLSRVFPFAIYYSKTNDTAFVSAILDCRRDPARIKQRVKKSAG